MTYDTAHRFAQALDPSALSTIGATLHAIEAARRDCREAGKPDEDDPAVVLLARHLGAVAAAGRPGDTALRIDCAAAAAAVRRQPALALLVAERFGGDERAKAIFHIDGRRALLRLASALGLAASRFDVRSCRGGPAVMGEVILHGEEVYVQIAQAMLGSDRSVLFRRVRGRSDYTGFANHWSSVDELLAPERFAERIRRELSLPAIEPVAATLFA